MAGTRARGDAGARYRDVVMANARIWTQNPAAQQRPTPPAGTRLGTLRAPLLVVTGDQDETGARAQADSIVARAPGARQATIRGAGHMLSTERPAELARLLDGFLRPSPEFAVAHAVLAHYRLLPAAHDSALVLADTAVVIPRYPDSGRGVPELAWLPGKLRGLAPATLADFRAVIGTQVPWWRDSLAARLGPQVRWESEHPPWEPRGDQSTPSAPPFLRMPPRARLSRVGFDPARRQALVYVEWVCGALCGHGMYVLLERGRAGAWAVRREFAFWSS